MKINAQINQEAESYISNKINNANTYPPGKLSSMFANYLLDNDLIKDRIIKVRYRIVKEEDIHQDGNIHYILEINQ